MLIEGYNKLMRVYLKFLLVLAITLQCVMFLMQTIRLELPLIKENSSVYLLLLGVVLVGNFRIRSCSAMMHLLILRTISWKALT